MKKANALIFYLLFILVLFSSITFYYYLSKKEVRAYMVSLNKIPPISKESKPLKTLLISENVDKNLFIFLEALKIKTKRENYLMVTSSFDYFLFKHYDIVICDKQLKEDQEDDLLRFSEDNSKKIIITKNCLTPSLSSKLGLSLEGEGVLQKGTQYKIKVWPNNIFKAPFEEYSYTPIININFKKIKCEKAFRVVDIKVGNEEYSLFSNPTPNILVVTYSLSTLFVDKPPLYDIILMKFLSKGL